MNFSFLRVTAGGVMLMALFGSLNSAASVVISEIMYHPALEDVREEFIELHNAGTTNMSLLGLRFSKGVQFPFPNVSLAAGDYPAHDLDWLKHAKLQQTHYWRCFANHEPQIIAQ